MSKNGRHIENPLVGVGAVILRDDMVLLVKRANEPYKGQWSIPGGKQKIAETVIEAVEREVYEETGIKLKRIKFLDFIDMILPDDNGKIIFHYTILEFEAKWLSGECRPGGDSKLVKWFKVNEIHKLKLSKKTKYIINRALKKNHI